MIKPRLGIGTGTESDTGAGINVAGGSGCDSVG